MSADKLRSFEAWSRSLRNFERWLGDAVPGGMDLDFLCERKGNFLVVEGKPFTLGVYVAYGQHIALQALAALEPFTVLLVGESKDRLYVMRYDQSKPQYRNKQAFWPASRFTPTTTDGLREQVHAWWEDCAGEQAA